MSLDRPLLETVKEIYLNREWEFEQHMLDVHSDLVLWDGNPRLLSQLSLEHLEADEDLELKLQMSPGYSGLKTSINKLGQMEPIYVWKPPAASHYMVLEGNTRVTILRELDRKYKSGNKEGTFRQARVKVLPPSFDAKYQKVLLARIHVRGSGVRAWGRYEQARHIYSMVTEQDGQLPLMNMSTVADEMFKSVSWVKRLRDAYEFARRFVDHVDNEDAERLAFKNFSVLEEASKARIIGPQLRDYDNEAHDDLRAEVFDMVKNEVFGEYRHARFLKEFHDDPEKWELLKTGEKHIAARLAAEVAHSTNSTHAKIEALPRQIEREISSGIAEYSDSTIAALEEAISKVNTELHHDIRPFRIQLRDITRHLKNASMADVEALATEEVHEFKRAFKHFDLLLQNYGPEGA